MKKILSISIVCLILDQLFKYIVVSNIDLYHGITIIPNFFSIFHIRNTGAAWSILEGNRILLIVMSLFALLVIYLFFIRNKELDYLESICYGILVGGILGNLSDRIIFGYVVDYLKFDIFNYHFPIFNFADICIVLSVVFMFIFLLRGEKKDDTRD